MINDAATPLAGSSATRTGWALLNLVFLGFSLLWSLVLLVGLLRRPRNRESENKRVFGRRDRFIRRLSKGLSGNFNGRIIAAALGAIALLVFVLTENLTLSMAWVDSWSPLMAAFLIAQDAITLRMLARENPAHESLADESPSFSSQQLTPPMPLA
jgi:hypothetical protein